MAEQDPSRIEKSWTGHLFSREVNLWQFVSCSLEVPVQATKGFELVQFAVHPERAKSEFASRNYYDVWLPNLAPSDRLSRPRNPLRMRPSGAPSSNATARKMSRPENSRVLDLLAALSHQANFSSGVIAMTSSTAIAPCFVNCWLSGVLWLPEADNRACFVTANIHLKQVPCEQCGRKARRERKWQ